MTHPFAWLSATYQTRFFFALLGFTLVVMFAINLMSTPLQNEQLPYGIVSFEFSGTAGQAQSYIASWDETVRLYAALGLGFDYLFLVAYASCLSLGCVLAAGRFASPTLGYGLAWGQLAAGLFDAVENAGLIALLFGSTSDSWAAVAWWCALFKFMLVGMGIIFILVGVAQRKKGSSNPLTNNSGKI